MTKNNQLKIDYLAFADDIDLITSTVKKCPSAITGAPKTGGKATNGHWESIISDQNKRSIKGKTHWHKLNPKGGTF